MESKEKAAGLISPGVEWRRLVQSTSLQSKIFVFKNRRGVGSIRAWRTGDRVDLSRELP